MNPRIKFGKIFLAVVVLGMGLMLWPNNSRAFSLKSSEIDQIVHSKPNYTLNALVMEVHLDKEYLVIAEKKIYVMDFETGGKHYKTTFIDEHGDISYAAFVKASQWEKKRVIVKAYRLPGGNIVAESIQRIGGRHK